MVPSRQMVYIVYKVWNMLHIINSHNSHRRSGSGVELWWLWSGWSRVLCFVVGLLCCGWTPGDDDGDGRRWSWLQIVHMRTPAENVLLKCHHVHMRQKKTKQAKKDNHQHMNQFSSTFRINITKWQSKRPWGCTYRFLRVSTLFNVYNTPIDHFAWQNNTLCTTCHIHFITFCLVLLYKNFSGSIPFRCPFI